MTFGTLAHRPAARRPAVQSFDRLMADLRRNLEIGALPRSRYAVQRPVRSALAPANTREFNPRISAEELENAYRVVAEVPGVEGRDLEINVEDGVLTIRGERFCGERLEADAAEAQLADADAGAISEETASVEQPAAPASVTFERKLRFGSEIVEGDVSANLRNGLLTVTIPKPEVVTPEVRTIPVETA